MVASPTIIPVLRLLISPYFYTFLHVMASLAYWLHILFTRDWFCQAILDQSTKSFNHMQYGILGKGTNIINSTCTGFVFWFWVNRFRIHPSIYYTSFWEFLFCLTPLRLTQGKVDWKICFQLAKLPHKQSHWIMLFITLSVHPTDSNTPFFQCQ